jgi:diguanylate cyclase (GGDEF)-like protein/PAS domain S-box-containing protein
LTVNEDHLGSVMNISADAIFFLDRASMRFTYCNDTATRMLGYSREEIYALSPGDVDMADDIPLIDVYEQIINSKRALQKEAIFRRKSGTSLPVEIQYQAQFLDNRWIIVLVVRDITERKKAESNFQPLAYYDHLTGLPNRQKFYQSLKTALAQAQKQSFTISLLFINVDKYREVNDSLGYTVGDQLLQQIGSRLINSLRIRDVVGHLGGDEFGLILFNSAGSQGASIVASKILEALSEPFSLDWNVVSITASIGISTYPSDTNDASTIIKFADSAMNEAKRAGGNSFRYYTAEMNTKMLEKRNLHDALRLAIESDEFVLHYQPKVHVDTGVWEGVEALIRWNRPGHGLVSPGLFIPALEETGLISAVGTWVINSACKQLALWEKSGIGPIRIAINISAKQFQQDNLVTSFVDAIREYDIDPSWLEIEITESLLMVDVERAVVVLKELGSLGIHVAIDDFGTGFSSLAYLQKFPVNNLKIDIAFIRNVTTNENDAAITTAIINMAHSLKLKVIAEGVETKDQLEFLQALKCDKFQGYYFSRPLPVSDLENLWKQTVL